MYVQSSVNACECVLLSAKYYASLIIYLVQKNACGKFLCNGGLSFRSLIRYCKTGYNQGVKFFCACAFFDGQYEL